MDLLENYPCIVVSAASLHVDFCNAAINRHGEVHIFDPVLLGDTKDLQFQFLAQCPMVVSISGQRPAGCVLRVRTLTRAACPKGQ